ncbi:uncharacterized protein PRCAT00005506001 [Priceomyces carsonii]|uniref:uncharacterized protein n=1 Tax=Priceomyces carsonii TaxID=28549 RepID=UPI002ED9D98E|nr:unnamed protein product [Priceomyces carsonii]
MITTTNQQPILRIIHSPLMPNPSKVRSLPFTWDETKTIVETNKLELFARSEEQTEKYAKFKAELKRNHTTIFKHLLIAELNWYDKALNNGIDKSDINLLDDAVIKFQPKSKHLFTEASDLKILPNHFPYYFQEGISHLCVWSKLVIENDPDSQKGDISKATRNLICKYVEKTFIEGLGIDRENVVWFRNWGALQSVKGISHIHVLVKGFTSEQLNKVLYTPGAPLTEAEYEEVHNEK